MLGRPGVARDQQARPVCRDLGAQPVGDAVRVRDAVGIWKAADAPAAQRVRSRAVAACPSTSKSPHTRIGSLRANAASIRSTACDDRWVSRARACSVRGQGTRVRPPATRDRAGPGSRPAAGSADRLDQLRRRVGRGWLDPLPRGPRAAKTLLPRRPQAQHRLLHDQEVVTGNRDPARTPLLAAVLESGSASRRLSTARWCQGDAPDRGDLLDQVVLVPRGLLVGYENHGPVRRARSSTPCGSVRRAAVRQTGRPGTAARTGRRGLQARGRHPGRARV